MTDGSQSSSEKPAPHKDFAKRLNEACDRRSQAPVGWGRQAWLRVEILSKCNIEVTREAVRRWFAGMTKPRTEALAAIAAVLGVDEAWLSYGSSPALTSTTDRRRIGLRGNGAVNFAAGVIQLAGAAVAFPDHETDEDPATSFYVIVDGRQRRVQVQLVEVQGNEFKVTFRAPIKDRALLAVLASETFLESEILVINREQLQEHGADGGGYISAVLQKSGTTFHIARKPVRRMRSLDLLI